MYNDDFLQRKLNERKDANAFRQLKIFAGAVDFCSNDYLGIVKNKLIQFDNKNYNCGSTGSRLLSGNSKLAEETEQQLAAFHESEAALIFNSGYDANMGVLAAVPQRGDTILYDQLCHASIRDGIRLSFAQSFSFVHNDINDLEKKLKQAAGNIFIVTESVFSMDGDICPLQEMIILCQQYNAHIILDEAHATGVIGNSGEGLAQSLQLHNAIFCRIYTFGKACGCHGAAVLGSAQLKNYLINFARPFIYTTALPEHSIAAIQKSYNIFPAMIAERNHLQQLIALFQSAELKYEKLFSQTPIQGIIVAGNAAAKEVSNMLLQKGFDVRAVLYPTVPKGKERLRIVLHAFNTVEEVAGLIESLRFKV